MSRTDLMAHNDSRIISGHRFNFEATLEMSMTRPSACVSKTRRCGVVLCALLACATIRPGFVWSDDAGQIENSASVDLSAMVDGDDLDAAIAAVSNLDLREPPTLFALAATVRIARRCEKEQRRDDAAEVYHTASAICERLVGNDAEQLSAEKAAVIWNAAASALTAGGRHADALRWSALAAESSSDPAMISRTGDTLLAVAAGALDSAEKLTAGKAYRLAIEMFEKHSSRQVGRDIATARLGYAWTLVMAADESGKKDHFEKSLAAVEDFLQHHPKHSDASSAYLLKLNCQTHLHDYDGVEATSDELFRVHPRSSAACEAVRLVCGSDRETTASLQKYLIKQYEYVLMSPIAAGSLDVLQSGLMASAIAGDADAETAYATALALIDDRGKVATSVLEKLQHDEHDAAAQRIAMGWLSAHDASDSNPGNLCATMQEKSGKLITGEVREAACRWAGRTGHWSMLAMAAEDEPGLYELQNTETAIQQTAARGRTLHVERLFAEALLQSGKTKKSLTLWERIVDDGGADDFATLVRLAETAAEVGSVAEASKRIAAARAVAMQSERAGGSSGSIAMTDLLAANLEIRQLRFDRGRSLLEQIVRSSGADANLRGRAQWMIGETYFMQEKFSDAIAAYRQVEGIGDCDEWTAASLVQAGKSFEQLGRTREATICYSALVSRFSESQHAGGARRRLAAISTDGTSSTGTIRR